MFCIEYAEAVLNLSNINIVTPKKALLATMLTASLVAGASALNKQSDNISVEKQRTEFVNNQSYKDKFISVVSTVDEYDSRILDYMSDKPDEPLTKKHKMPVRIFAGLIMSIIGIMVGNLRDERGKKYIATPDSASNIGFISGFILPGISSCAVLVASVGVILKSIATSVNKK